MTTGEMRRRVSLLLESRPLDTYELARVLGECCERAEEYGGEWRAARDELVAHVREAVEDRFNNEVIVVRVIETLFERGEALREAG